MRGGQLTMFVVLGLVMVVVVGLFYVILVGTRPTGSQAGAGDRQVVSSTIESCIDSIVTEELRAIGKTGGVVEFTGYPAAVVDLGTDTRRIIYGVTHNVGGDGMLPQPHRPPRYPDNGVEIRNTERNPATGLAWPSWASGYFGDVNIPAVCSIDGTNRPGSGTSCESYPGIPPGTTGPSMQAGLERRIAQRVQACASPRLFADVLGRDVDRVLQPEANVTFTTTNTLVSVAYPLELPGETTVRVSRFSRAYKVRFLGIAQFATDLAREETRNVTFAIDEDYRDITSYRPGFSVFRSDKVEIVRHWPGAQTDLADLITIVDRESVLDGQAFTFSFLVERRPPMLDPATALDIDEWLSGNTSALQAVDPDDTMTVITICTDCVPPQVQARDEDGRKDWQALP